MANWHFFRGKLVNHSKSKRKCLEIKYQGKKCTLGNFFFFLTHRSFRLIDLLPMGQIVKHPNIWSNSTWVDLLRMQMYFSCYSTGNLLLLFMAEGLWGKWYTWIHKLWYLVIYYWLTCYKSWLILNISRTNG